MLPIILTLLEPLKSRNNKLILQFGIEMNHNLMDTVLQLVTHSLPLAVTASNSFDLSTAVRVV